MQKDKRTALITGASGGIGYELTKLFAADGYNLVLVARSEQKLNNIAADLSQTFGINAIVLAKDLSEPTAPDEIFTALQIQSITIDALVNNAGFGVYGQFANTDLVEEMDMLQLNVVAVTHLTKLFLPGMIKRSFGRILNVGSTGSFMPIFLMAGYGATKAYVLSLSEAIAQEVKGTGVSVTALCPGVTLTGFQARADVENTRLASGYTMSAQDVAEIGYQALKRGKTLVIPGLWNRLLILLARFMPRSLSARAGRRIMERVES